MLEHREVLGDLDRVVGRDQRGRGRQQELVGLRGDVAQRGRGRAAEERLVVVLTDGVEVEADLFGLLGDRDGRLDALVLAGGVTRRRVGGDVAHREDADLHDHS